MNHHLKIDTFDEIIKGKIEDIVYYDTLSQTGMTKAISFIKEKMVDLCMVNMTKDVFTEFERDNDYF